MIENKFYCDQIVINETHVKFSFLTERDILMFNSVYRPCGLPVGI